MSRDDNTVVSDKIPEKRWEGMVWLDSSYSPPMPFVLEGNKLLQIGSYCRSTRIILEIAA